MNTERMLHVLQHRLAHGAVGLLLLASAAAVALFVYTSVQRIGFRYELEWMEGGILQHVARLLEGQALYAQPSLEFVPFVYTPFYYYVCAPLCALLGVELVPLRLVSFAAALGVCWLLYAVARTCGQPRFTATFAAGLFAVTFPLSGGWFDLARVDSLALCLALAGLRVALTARSDAGFAASGALAALAVLTKQTSAAVEPAIVLYLVLSRRFRGLGVHLLVAGVLLFGTCAWFEWRSDGWFSYYTLELPRQHGIAQREHLLTQFWTDELWAPQPLTCALALLAVLSELWFRRARALAAAAASLLLVGMAFPARLHQASYVNDLMPAHAGLALLASAGVDAFARLRLWRTRALPTLAASTLGALQLWWLAYSPAPHLPDPAGSIHGDRVVAWLKATPGEVLIPNHPYLNLLAGKPAHAHLMGVVDTDMAESDVRSAGARLARSFEHALAGRRFSTVVLDNEWFPYLDSLNTHYVRVDSPLLAGVTGLLPRTGTPCRPELVYVPR